MGRFFDEHYYAFSSAISLVIFIVVIFFIDFQEHLTGLEENDIVELSAIDQYQPPAKKAVRELSEEGEQITDPNQRAEGSSDNEVFDLAFYPGVNKPRLLGSLPEIFPKKAKELGVEATVILEIDLSSSGSIRRIKVISVILKKKLPSALATELKNDFSRDVKKMFRGMSFSVTKIDGKARPIRLEQEVEMILK